VPDTPDFFTTEKHSNREPDAQGNLYKEMKLKYLVWQSHFLYIEYMQQ